MVSGEMAEAREGRLDRRRELVIAEGGSHHQDVGDVDEDEVKDTSITVYGAESAQCNSRQLLSKPFMQKEGHTHHRTPWALQQLFCTPATRQMLNTNECQACYKFCGRLLNTALLWFKPRGHCAARTSY